MRSSEEMAYAIYLADWQDTPTRNDPDFPLSWDELTEEQQANFLRYAQTALKHLFEHGRISAYLSYNHLETLKAEYKAYLAEKNKENLWQS